MPRMPSGESKAKGLLDQAGNACRVEGIGKAARADRADRGEGVLALAVDAVSGAQLFRKREAAVEHIDGDDRVGAGDLRSHDGGKANRTCSEDRDRRAFSHRHAAQHGAPRRS